MPQETSIYQEIGNTSHLNLLELPFFHIVDRDGIPQASNRAPEELIAGINFDLKECPFPTSPSRYPDGKPHKTPMSGFERDRLAVNYREIKGIVLSSRKDYLESIRGVEVGTQGPMNFGETFDFVQGMACISEYLTLRSVNPVGYSGELPESIVILANAMKGIRAANGAYFVEIANPQGIEKSMPKAKEIIDVAERYGNMVGPDTVCVAHPTLMDDFITLIMNGSENEGNNVLSSYLVKGEMTKVVQFGKEEVKIEEGAARVSQLDTELFELFHSAARRGDAQQVDKVLDVYSRRMEQVIKALYEANNSCNYALGRAQNKYSRSEIERNFILKMPQAIEMWKQLSKEKAKPTSSSKDRRKFLR